jgi:hypothetical protein
MPPHVVEVSVGSDHVTVDTARLVMVFCEKLFFIGNQKCFI